MIFVIDQILGKFSHDLGIDLGTANTLVFVRGKGIVIREPSIVAQHRKTKKIIAIGTSAKRMIGRTPATIEAVRPLKDGVVSDFDTTSAMLSYFVNKVHSRPGSHLTMARPRVIIGVPAQISDIERRAVLEAARAAGARSAYLIEEPMAAAIGADLPVSEPVGSMIIDIGGGTCEIAVISLSGIVVGRSLKLAGDAMNRDITSYIRARYGLGIGEATAEEIKISLGSATPFVVEKEMVIRGRDLERGLPKSVRLASSGVREAITGTIAAIVEAVRDVINDTPPELAADIAERGIILCGGGSQISGLAKLISGETKMPVSVATDALNCVVLGCAKLFENPTLLKKVSIAKISS